VETGGPKRNDHVRWTRSWLVALSVVIAWLGALPLGWPPRHPRADGCEPSAAACKPRRGVFGGRHMDHAFHRHAAAADPGRYRLYGACPTHNLVFDLTRWWSGVVFFVRIVDATLPSVAPAAVLLGGRHRQHALCRDPLGWPEFAIPAHGRGAVDADRRSHSLWRPAVFLARQEGVRIAEYQRWSSGVAVSGMHDTRFYGMHFVAAGRGMSMRWGLAASQQMLALVVAMLDL